MGAHETCKRGRWQNIKPHRFARPSANRPPLQREAFVQGHGIRISRIPMAVAPIHQDDPANRREIAMMIKPIVQTVCREAAVAGARPPARCERRTATAVGAGSRPAERARDTRKIPWPDKSEAHVESSRGTRRIELNRVRRAWP